MPFQAAPYTARKHAARQRAPACGGPVDSRAAA